MMLGQRIRKSSLLKGKTYEEIHGVEKATELRLQRSLLAKGHVSSQKGKTYEEMFGAERAAELKLKRSKCRLGIKNPMFGKHLSEETKRKLSESVKLFFVTNPGIMKGKEKRSQKVIYCEVCGKFFNIKGFGMHHKMHLLEKHVAVCERWTRKIWNMVKNMFEHLKGWFE